eukprot:CAMPEP_0183500772 /NCGR_PEP_ID=MMETSP0371-20130417/2824_1 /TAXON_ID=268820 /ORGANISM="Peridinium aciculiferum, Strain PAER-2" /LENGTH=48 /DNA_ID= /DNA_START= /DNA_END= /DNA_ORIENTATION=
MASQVAARLPDHQRTLGQGCPPLASPTMNGNQPDVTVIASKDSAHNDT